MKEGSVIMVQLEALKKRKKKSCMSDCLILTSVIGFKQFRVK